MEISDLFSNRNYLLLLSLCPKQIRRVIRRTRVPQFNNFYPLAVLMSIPFTYYENDLDIDPDLYFLKMIPLATADFNLGSWGGQHSKWICKLDSNDPFESIYKDIANHVIGEMVRFGMNGFYSYIESNSLLDIYNSSLEFLIALAKSNEAKAVVEKFFRPSE